MPPRRERGAPGRFSKERLRRLGLASDLRGETEAERRRQEERERRHRASILANVTPDPEEIARARAQEDRFPQEQPPSRTMGDLRPGARAPRRMPGLAPAQQIERGMGRPDPGIPSGESSLPPHLRPQQPVEPVPPPLPTSWVDRPMALTYGGGLRPQRASYVPPGG